MLRVLTATALPLLPLSALAHEGHGAPGASHWHATDTWGLMLTLGGAALALWLARRK